MNINLKSDRYFIFSVVKEAYKSEIHERRKKIKERVRLQDQTKPEPFNLKSKVTMLYRNLFIVMLFSICIV